VLQALKRLLSRAPDPAQLDLNFTHKAPETADELHERLRELGLRRIERVRLTQNSTVMVSFGDGVLRVHEGFLEAPEGVHRAIVAFVEGRTRAQRRDAQRVLITHPIKVAKRARRRTTMHPDDQPLAERIAEWHARYNEQHFACTLKEVDVVVSRRMRSRLGHYGPASSPEGRAEIAISRRHIKRHGWTEALNTLLHEMVHQWQDESSHVIDHGSDFRRKARELGITARAKRAVGQ
jgi:hypothetical protein